MQYNKAIRKLLSILYLHGLHVIKSAVCVQRARQPADHMANQQQQVEFYIELKVHIFNDTDAIVNLSRLGWVLTTPCCYHSLYYQIQFLEIWSVKTDTCYQMQYQTPSQVLLQRHNLHLQNKIQIPYSL